MDVFCDLEFVENGPAIPIVPVSIALVTLDGRQYYGINSECLSKVMRHPWTSVNLIPGLPVHIDRPLSSMGGGIYDWDDNHPEIKFVKPLDRLVEEVRTFLLTLAAESKLRLWADYAAYDHVVLCQLFGSMAELPPGIPMFTHELRMLIEEHPEVQLPPQPLLSHHSLYDAEWCRDAYLALHGDYAPPPSLLPHDAHLDDIVPSTYIRNTEFSVPLVDD